MKVDRSCLFIDMAYSLEEVRRRRHFQFFEARHSGGYFDKVIALHPLADRVAKLDESIERKQFSDRQEVIEAKSASLGLPRLLFPLDFALSQRRLLNRVSEIVRNERISVISATDPLYSGLFGLWVSRRTGVPLVIHLVANYDFNYSTTRSLAMPRLFPTRAIEKQVIRSVLRAADLVAAGTETLREYAIAEGARREHTEVFRVSKNMVPEHRIHPRDRAPLTAEERNRLGIASSDKLLLTVARLEPVKMVDHAVKAFSVVAKEHPGAVLLLAGDGSDRPRLEALVRELGLGDRVRFLGLVDQDLLTRLEPHCLTLSPLTGMALFETSMAGSPAIAYDCDSTVREQIETGVTGVLVETGHWQSMGQAAARLLRDPAAIERMSKAIRERVEKLTDEEAIYAHEHAVFDRIIGH